MFAKGFPREELPSPGLPHFKLKWVQLSTLIRLNVARPFRTLRQGALEAWKDPPSLSFKWTVSFSISLSTFKEKRKLKTAGDATADAFVVFMFAFFNVTHIRWKRFSRRQFFLLAAKKSAQKFHLHEEFLSKEIFFFNKCVSPHTFSHFLSRTYFQTVANKTMSSKRKGKLFQILLRLLWKINLLNINKKTKNKTYPIKYRNWFQKISCKDQGHMPTSVVILLFLLFFPP